MAYGWLPQSLPLALMLASAYSVPAKSAGLFDGLANALFGTRAPVVTINPFFEPERRVSKPRRVTVTKPAAPAVKLDPKADPQWYLKDPTLQRGDIDLLIDVAASPALGYV